MRKKERRMAHNVHLKHSDRIQARKLLRASRVATQPEFEVVWISPTRSVKRWSRHPLKVSKYDPRTEDEKHRKQEGENPIEMFLL